MTADYQGEIPMVGFGAGAYVNALWQRGGAAPTVDAATGNDAGPDGGPAGDGDGGGCCQTGGEVAGLWPALALALALRRRRR